MVLKRHWIVFVLLGVYATTGLLITIILYVLMWFHIFVHILNILFWLGFSLFLYVCWLDHELDMFIITNYRVIGVEQHSLLNRDVSECDLSKIQEVNSSTKWFFANIFNYGVLSIQTAWNSFILRMAFVPDPITQARKILNLLNEHAPKK